jgi:hypothetical protein
MSRPLPRREVGVNRRLLVVKMRAIAAGQLHDEVMSTALRNLGLAIAAGALAVLCLLSVTGAAVVGACTLVAVAIDSRRSRIPATRRSEAQLIVDLSRRAR